MRRDESVIVLGEDVAGAAGRAHLGLVDAWGGPLRATRGLIAEFGERESSTRRSPRWASSARRSAPR